MSDGLPQPHVEAASDRSANVDDGHRCQAHCNRLANTSTDEENAELVA